MPNQDPYLTDEDVAAYERDGAVCLKGVFSDWVDVIRAGIARNMGAPGPYALDYIAKAREGTGSFFDDYCNWARIAEIEDVVRNSPAAEIAAAVTRSRTAQFFHDHVLVKEPGTSKETPWHQDMPYYFVDGDQAVSFWIPVDPVDDATLRIIAGSHKWEKFVMPTRWTTDENFYAGPNEYLPVPDPDAADSDLKVVEWSLEPGDAVLFHYRAVHGARANMNSARRRALSLRWLGDDMRYCERPGKTSPPFPGHEMTQGQRLREDWFPVLYSAAQ